MYINNKVVGVEITGVSIETPGVQTTANKVKNNKDEDYDTSEGADERILEGGMHHTQLTSPNERLFNLRPSKPRNYANHCRVDCYAHAQIVH